MKKILFLAIIAIFLLQSCATVTPNVPITVIPEKGGELHLQGSVGVPAANAGALYSLSKNISIVGNGNYGFDFNSTFNRKAYETGIQLSYNFNKVISVGITPTYGKAFYDYEYSSPSIFGAGINTYNGKGVINVKSLFLNSSYKIINTDIFQLSCTLGTRYVENTNNGFHNTNNNLLTLENQKQKSLDIIGSTYFQFYNFGIFGTLGYDVLSKNNSSKIDYNRVPLLISGGINFKFNTFSKKKNIIK